jgi:hypothetical protein
MASKKELETDNVELRKQVERAIRELDRFGSELAEIVRGLDDAEARAIRILARRAHLVAEELGAELREGLDPETVGLLVRFFRHEYTRKAIGGLITGLAAKYGPELVEHAELALDAVENLAGITASGSRIGLEQGGGLLLEDGNAEPSASVSVNPGTVTVQGEVPRPTVRPDATKRGPLDPIFDPPARYGAPPPARSASPSADTTAADVASPAVEAD